MTSALSKTLCAHRDLVHRANLVACIYPRFLPSECDQCATTRRHVSPPLSCTSEIFPLSSFHLCPSFQLCSAPSCFLQSLATDDVPPILDALFECTLDMINKDLEVFPEHRTNFFRMLQSVTAHCFSGNVQPSRCQSVPCGVQGTRI